MDKVRELLPSSTLQPIDGLERHLSSGALGADAIALPAERGSAWTLIYPRYTVVVPGPSPIRLPLGYPLPRTDAGFARFVDTWIELKQKDGTIQALYDHWILGKETGRPRPRWSILRDVLHWVD